MAQLIREVKYLTAVADPWVKRWARRLLDAIGDLFRTYHREADQTPRDSARAMAKVRDRILKIGKRHAARRRGAGAERAVRHRECSDKRIPLRTAGYGVARRMPHLPAWVQE